MDHDIKNINELQDIFASRGIKYYRNMSKNKMIEMLKKNDEVPSIFNDLDTSERFQRYNKTWLQKNGDMYQKHQKNYQKKYWLKRFTGEDLINPEEIEPFEVKKDYKNTNMKT